MGKAKDLILELLQTNLDSSICEWILYKEFLLSLAELIYNWRKMPLVSQVCFEE